MNQIGGMSDLCNYELEDIGWDELDQIDDHIVPHPSNEHENEALYQEVSFKKLRHEATGKEEKNIQSREEKNKKLMGKDALSHSAAVQDSLNSSNIDMMNAEFHADDKSQTENDFSFLDNDRKDSESADLLYYGWNDIENFQDVDRMFRGCDSTFEFGSSNDDDLAWLSSSHNIEEPEGVLQPDFSPFNNIPESNLSKPENANFSGNDSNTGSSYISYKSSVGEADGKGECTPKEQQGVQFNSDILFDNSTAYQSLNGNSQRKKQATRPNLSEGKKKHQYKFRQVFAHPDHQKQKKNITQDAFNYLQTPTSYMNYIHPSNQTSLGSQISGIKSEINSLTSVSLGDSSYASNQLRPMEVSYSHPFSAPVMSVDEKLEKLRRRQGFYHSSALNKIPDSQNYNKTHTGIERGNEINLADQDSQNVPETSCKSTGFDEISLEASSFRQLQQVLEQLDIRTKLCIRDSLYRLARSAEQRHRYANMKGGGQSGEAGDGSNSGFMDMETDTNPIDRSVAHLLFHRPSDPSVRPTHDSSSLKSHTMIHGSITSPPVMVEHLVCQEEAANEVEKKVSFNDDG